MVVNADVQAAVAALQAAGDDTDALSASIAKASFLDEIPGEDRQKLRGMALVVQHTCTIPPPAVLQCTELIAAVGYFEQICA